ncbi:glutenin, high molecular weight subunit PW212-like [Belonocnema kinseyi]|uniref:glutenin, high molecular weight subunit PW212-like n=1 Tax=Belonocnema kinseyi TaxID=2817044 RepID=UPI00143D978F|nr:glutenin, high molecular weight subunit PW212-like [Belonocnema kinseyi]
MALTDTGVYGHGQRVGEVEEDEEEVVNEVELSLSAPADNPPKGDVPAETEKDENDDHKQQDAHGDTGGHGHGDARKHHQLHKSHKHHKHHSHHDEHGSVKKSRHDKEAAKHKKVTDHHHGQKNNKHDGNAGDNKKPDPTGSPTPTGLPGTTGLPGQSGLNGKTGLPGQIGLSGQIGLPVQSGLSSQYGLGSQNRLPSPLGQYGMSAQNPQFGQQEQQLLNRVPQNSLPSGQTQQSATPATIGTPTSAGQLGAQRAQSVNPGLAQTQPGVNPGSGPIPTQAHSSGQGVDLAQAQSFGPGLKHQALLNPSQAGIYGQLGTQGAQAMNPGVTQAQTKGLSPGQGLSPMQGQSSGPGQNNQAFSNPSQAEIAEQIGAQSGQAVNPGLAQSQTAGPNPGKGLSPTQAHSSGQGLKDQKLLNASQAGIAGQLETQGAQAMNPGVTQTQTKGSSAGQGLSPIQAQSSGPGLNTQAFSNSSQAGIAGQMGAQRAQAVNPGLAQTQTGGPNPETGLSSTQAHSSGQGLDSAQTQTFGPGLKDQKLLNASQAGIAGQLGTQGAQAVNPGAAQTQTQGLNHGQGLNPTQAQSSGLNLNAAPAQSSDPSLNPTKAQNSGLGLNPTQSQRPGGAEGAL